MSQESWQWRDSGLRELKPTFAERTKVSPEALTSSASLLSTEAGTAPGLLRDRWRRPPVAPVPACVALRRAGAGGHRGAAFVAGSPPGRASGRAHLRADPRCPLRSGAAPGRSVPSPAPVPAPCVRVGARLTARVLDTAARVRGPGLGHVTAGHDEGGAKSHVNVGAQGQSLLRRACGRAARTLQPGGLGRVCPCSAPGLGWLCLTAVGEMSGVAMDRDPRSIHRQERVTWLL